MPRESNRAYRKALDLMIHADATSTPEVPLGDRSLLAELRALVDRAKPTTTTSSLLLIDRYIHSGEYARAEDVLFDALDSLPLDPAIVERGLTMYEELASLDDSDLAAGNLPREEVAAGLADLRARKSPI